MRRLVATTRGVGADLCGAEPYPRSAARLGSDSSLQAPRLAIPKPAPVRRRRPHRPRLRPCLRRLDASQGDGDRGRNRPARGGPRAGRKPDAAGTSAAALATATANANAAATGGGGKSGTSAPHIPGSERETRPPPGHEACRSAMSRRHPARPIPANRWRGPNSAPSTPNNGLSVPGALRPACEQPDEAHPPPVPANVPVPPAVPGFADLRRCRPPMWRRCPLPQPAPYVPPAPLPGVAAAAHRLRRRVRPC